MEPPALQLMMMMMTLVGMKVSQRVFVLQKLAQIDGASHASVTYLRRCQKDLTSEGLEAHHVCTHTHTLTYSRRLSHKVRQTHTLSTRHKRTLALTIQQQYVCVCVFHSVICSVLS